MRIGNPWDINGRSRPWSHSLVRCGSPSPLPGFLVTLLVMVIDPMSMGQPASPPPPTPAYTCTFEARFDRLAADYLYYCIPVQGTTNLPDGALLDVEAFYMKPVSDIFKRPGRPPPPPDPYLLDSAEIRPEKGRFNARLWLLKRAPYAGSYRIRASLHWRKQPGPLRGDNPEDRDPLAWQVDLTWGTEEDLARERESVRKEVRTDLDTLSTLHRELAARFRRALREPDEARGWSEWVQAQLRPISARNAQRLENQVIWTETQGKYRVQDLTDRIEELLKLYTEAVGRRATTIPHPIDQQEKAFAFIYESALELLGFLKPTDPNVVRDHLGPIQDDLARLQKTTGEMQDGRRRMTPADIETLRIAIFSRLQVGLGEMLAAAPKQAAEPATAYTEAIASFFSDALALVRGEAGYSPSRLTDHLRTATGHLQQLRAMLTAP